MTPSKLLLGLMRGSNISKGMCGLQYFKIFLVRTVILEFAILLCIKASYFLIVNTSIAETTLA